MLLIRQRLCPIDVGRVVYGFPSVGAGVAYGLYPATLLLLGLDPESPRRYHNGLMQRPTVFEGKGIHDLLA